MKTMSAKDAKNAFGRLLDTARAEPVIVEKHGRPVVVVLAVEEFERLNSPGHNHRGKKASRLELDQGRAEAWRPLGLANRKGT